MTKVIFEGVINNIIIALFAWAAFDRGIIPISLLWVTLAVFFGFAFISTYRETGSFKGAFEPLVKGVQFRQDSDERDALVTQKATKAAYQSCVLALLLSILGLSFVGILANEGVIEMTGSNMLIAGITTTTLAFMIVQSTFFISWCYYYNK